jgi:hypothetical protein
MPTASSEAQVTSKRLIQIPIWMGCAKARQTMRIFVYVSDLLLIAYLRDSQTIPIYQHIYTIERQGQVRVCIIVSSIVSPLRTLQPVSFVYGSKSCLSYAADSTLQDHSFT